MARPSKQKIQPTVSRADGKSQPLNRERIAADLAAFRKSGGRIEVLPTFFRPGRPANDHDGD
ncbi:MAG TPA: hypothetical protein VIP30_13165 [Stenotrophomonas sp.]|jgi:hypothetical protein|nr:hypothetical protein [Stenotrophomonas sp.]